MSDTSRATLHAPTRLDASALFATFAGFCASLVAIGLARFAYTPLIPALIQAHWFNAADTVTLGAANFAGYLLGAMSGRRIAHRLGNRAALRMLMLLASVAFLACAYPLSTYWFFLWRCLSGIAGGAIMVLVASTILPQIPLARRGMVGGIIFLGLGIGIAASGTVIPLLLTWGLRETWFGLGALSLLLTGLSWFGWPPSPAPELPAVAGEVPKAALPVLGRLYLQYAANALGIVPAMVFLVDYIARGLGEGTQAGANYWVLYGFAAIVGPLVAGTMTDRLSSALAYRIALVLQALALLGLSLSHHPLVLVGATVIMGAFTPGVVPLVLGRIQSALPNQPVAQRTAWSKATTGFALAQVAGGYGYSWLFSHSGEDYSRLFACGAVALVLALCAERRTS